MMPCETQGARSPQEEHSIHANICLTEGKNAQLIILLYIALINTIILLIEILGKDYLHNICKELVKQLIPNILASMAFQVIISKKRERDQKAR